MTGENITGRADQIGNDSFTRDQLFEKSGDAAAEFATIHGNVCN
tara:strand:+ start:1153 stop:1284 length:132 start_codon:yes stop_codon:yes gene_type:complete